MQDPYLYAGTETLINLFGERSESRLKEIEANYLSEEFSRNMASLWKIHPFREGNTRTVINFCCDMSQKHGIPIDRESAANAVFKDIGDKSNHEYLQRIVFDAMKN